MTENVVEGGFMNNVTKNISFSSIGDNINQLKPFGIYILIAIILSGISYFVYIQYWDKLKSKFKHPNAEYNKSQEQDIELLLFETSWCPHCKDAKSNWNVLKEKYHNQTFSNGKKLTFIEHDCEENEDICEQYKIEGYPTIKMNTKDEIIEFDGEPTIEGLTEFIKNVVGTDKIKTE